MIASFISMNPDSSILMIGITPDDLPNVTGDILAPTIDIVAACAAMNCPPPNIVQIIFGQTEAQINAQIAVAFEATVKQYGGSMVDVESALFEVDGDGVVAVTENSIEVERAAADAVKKVQTRGGTLN